MLVEVLKENYILVLAEDAKDDRWLEQARYDLIGEEYYQYIFKDTNDLISEVEALIEYGAVFEDRFDDEDAPHKVVEDLKVEGLIK